MLVNKWISTYIPLDYAGFQASAVKKMRTALYWAITQRVMIIYYRRFGTKTSARNDYYTQRNGSENRSSHSSTTSQCSTGFGSCVYFILLQRFDVTALCCVVSLSLSLSLSCRGL